MPKPTFSKSLAIAVESDQYKLQNEILLEYPPIRKDYLHVDSTGLVTQPGLSRSRKLASIALFSSSGALSGIHSGGEGAGIGAAAGAGFGSLVVSLDSRPYSDFELKKGRKLWLRLNTDLR